MAAYGIDVHDPGITPRRLAVLVDRLPPWARQGGAPWSTEAYLLAEVIDRLDALTFVTLRAHGAKSVSKPRGFPRPPHPRPLAGRPPAADTGPGRAQSGEGPGGWMRAAGELAVIPGVLVEHEEPPGG
jgi:hypothetical protein